MIVRLLGLNHGHQLQGYALGDWRAFDAYLSEFCVVNKIDLIGEELSEEALALWHATDSVARTVAVRLLIEHLFCDPESEERHRLGILTDKEAAAKLGFGRIFTPVQGKIVTEEVRKTWPAREGVWLERLCYAQFDECLFILGSDHVDTFDALLSGAGYEVTVVDRDWKP